MIFTWLETLKRQQTRRHRASIALRSFRQGLSAHLQKDIGLNDPETLRKRLENSAHEHAVNRLSTFRSTCWFIKRRRRP